MSRERDRDEDQDTKVKAWETLGSEKIADCHVFTLYRHKRRSPGGALGGEFHTLEAPDWVNVIALTEHRELVMVRQYRHGIDEITWEIPGGMIDSGESPEEGGGRELLEETGYEGDKGVLIGSLRPNPAFLNNTQHTVLIRNVRKVATQSLDESEEIDVAVYSLDQVEQMVANGDITHGLVLNALYWMSRYER